MSARFNLTAALLRENVIGFGSIILGFAVLLGVPTMALAAVLAAGRWLS